MRGQANFSGSGGNPPSPPLLGETLPNSRQIEMLFQIEMLPEFQNMVNIKIIEF